MAATGDLTSDLTSSIIRLRKKFLQRLENMCEKVGVFKETGGQSVFVSRFVWGQNDSYFSRLYTLRKGNTDYWLLLAAGAKSDLV